MYLKRLEITGFKSFASKTVLSFDHGITAIVGPNGSGKSNIADAIRWTLGEQSVRNLRLKKSDEVVFAGTDKKPRASLAEVTLQLDNSDGQMPIDFTEVEVSRRLYRSGEAEYRLAGRKVPLKDIQQLLVQAGFGPSSYSVIGQGMIDSLVLATPAERKLLFEEASGVREFEIRRAETVRRIDATGENLTRMRDILAELEPRLRSLAKAAEAATVRRELETELLGRRRTLLASRYQQAVIQRDAAEVKIKRLAAERSSLVKAVRQYEKERDDLEVTRRRSAAEHAGLTDQLAALEQRRDRVADDLSVERAELQMMLESSSQRGDSAAELERLKQELTALEKRRQQLAKELTSAQDKEQAAQAELDGVGREVASAQSALTRLRRQTDESSQHQYLMHALSIVRDLARSFDTKQPERGQLKLMLYKVGRLLKLATSGQKDTLEQLKLAQTTLTVLMRRREDAHSQAAEAAMRARSLELDLGYAETTLRELKVRVGELAAAARKTTRPQPIAKRQQMVARLEVDLEAINTKVTELRGRLGDQPAPVDQPIFELAAALEGARAKLAAVEEESAAVRQEYEQAIRELKDLGKPATDEASDQPVADQERAIELLEARLAAYRDDEDEEEYQAVHERHTFIKEQVSDLEVALADLTEALQKLDRLISERFDAAFGDISRHFASYFHRLFGGGTAQLTLDRSDGDVGIEIKAVPPGKRSTSLAMLSGGERALTGIALLAAILHRSPSPFVVLDEVDAALDEANSTRFAEILQTIGKRTQLIVITHNRRTMQAASTLYGVTMDDHHISHLVSLRLDDARSLVPQAS